MRARAKVPCRPNYISSCYHCTFQRVSMYWCHRIFALALVFVGSISFLNWFGNPNYILRTNCCTSINLFHHNVSSQKYMDNSIKMNVLFIFCGDLVFIFKSRSSILFGGEREREIKHGAKVFSFHAHVWATVLLHRWIK